MKVYLDEQERLDLPCDAGALSILDAVKAQVSKTGRVITEIKVDSITMDEDAFSNVTAGRQVDFTSQPVRALVCDTLSEALKYIPRLTKGLDEIAAHFEGNELALGQGKLANAADGMDWLLLVFQNCSSFLSVAEESGLSELKQSLFSSINLLGTLHEEKKYLQMALCIRQKLVPDIGKFSLHMKGLYDLSASTQ